MSRNVPVCLRLAERLAFPDILLFDFPHCHRACRLPATIQAFDSLPDTVSSLFPDQAEAQLSAKTQGMPTVLTQPESFNRVVFDGSRWLDVTSVFYCDSPPLVFNQVVSW